MLTHVPQIIINNYFLTPPPVSLRPKSNVHFTGRQEILKKLKVYFGSQFEPQSQQRRLYLIYGMGGIGKTQICLRLIEEMSSQ